MDKNTEIKLLNQLKKADSYFADTFSEEDVEKMKSNIKNDFPILHDTDIINRLNKTIAACGVLRKELDETQAKIETRNNTIQDLEKDLNDINFWKTMVWKVLSRENQNELLKELFTVNENIKFKLSNGIPLDEEEAEQVLRQLQ